MVDTFFRKLMHNVATHSKLAMDTFGREKLLHLFEENNKRLEKIQKGMSDYLGCLPSNPQPTLPS
jgi:hypothetical protein